MSHSFGPKLVDQTEVEVIDGKEFRVLRQWTPGAAAAALRIVYRRILDREIDDDGLVVYGGQLISGRNLRAIIRDIGHSTEYRDRFVTPFTLRQVARLMYVKFLAREPESETALNGHAADIAANGYKAGVDSFIDSQEYRERFGDNGVPQ